MMIELACIYKFSIRGLVFPSPSHPLDSLFLIVHLKCGVELSDHDFILVMIECHDVLQPSTLNLGQQPLKRSLFAHEISFNPILVIAHCGLLESAPEEIILILSVENAFGEDRGWLNCFNSQASWKALKQFSFHLFRLVV